MKIVLLDLNATLVENTEVHRLPYKYNVSKEKYRRWLIDLLAPHFVILLTVRPASYKIETLKNLMAKEKWLPHEAHFTTSKLNAPEAKGEMLKRCVFPQHGEPEDIENGYLALESNSRTRKMYSTHGIMAYTQQQIFENPKILLSD